MLRFRKFVSLVMSVTLFSWVKPSQVGEFVEVGEFGEVGEVADFDDVVVVGEFGKVD